MAAAPDGFDIFMSVPYAADNDTTTTGSKATLRTYVASKGPQNVQSCPSRLHSPPGCLSRLPNTFCVIYAPTAELPIAPAFAAGLPIAPATIPLSALALPIATYCSGDPNTIRREGTA
jgi:hypothetical protein